MPEGFEYPLVDISQLDEGDTILYDSLYHRWRTGPGYPSIAKIKGIVAEVGDIPAGPPADLTDMYLVEASGEGYMWVGGAWTSLGPIQGPPGPPGESGPELAAGSGIDIEIVGDLAIISALAGGGSVWEHAAPLSVGEWTIPESATVAWIQAWAAGGGGGSGRRGAAGTARFGGAGGGGGNYWQGIIPLGLLRTQGFTTLYVEGLLGGAGGTAITNNDTNGNAGSNAGNLTIRGVSGNDASTIVRVAGGKGGAGGTTTQPSGGTGGDSHGTHYGRPGLPGYGGASAPSGFEAGFAVLYGLTATDKFQYAPTGGGGGGGGISTANAAVSGSSGMNAAGMFVSRDTTPGAAGTSGSKDGKAPVTPAPTTTTGMLVGAGAGGGGGYPGIGGAAGAGGTGTMGCGGGGGGASENGQTSGAGARGGPGFVRIVSW